MENNKCIKILVFLLPVLMFVMFFFPYELRAITNIGLILIPTMYPIISVIIFYDNKILIWSAPIAFAILAIISIIWLKISMGSSNLEMMVLIPYSFLMFSGWSIICVLIALLIKYICKKNQK